VVASLVAEFAHVDLERGNFTPPQFAQAVLPQRGFKVSRWCAVQDRQQCGFLSHTTNPLIRYNIL
jgi:hypothetical protein